MINKGEISNSTMNLCASKYGKEEIILDQMVCSGDPCPADTDYILLFYYDPL